MSLDKLAALNAINCRIDHTSSTAMLIAESAASADSSDLTNAIRGIAETLKEIAARMDQVVNLRDADAQE